jgi:hypothetical protein
MTTKHSPEDTEDTEDTEERLRRGEAHLNLVFRKLKVIGL